jgi:hypothetical protein
MVKVHYDLLQTANFQLASNMVSHQFVAGLKLHSGQVRPWPDARWTPEIGGGASTLSRSTATSEITLII